MATTANGTFNIKNWDEKPYNEIEDVPKLTRASIVLEYHGDIEGESTLDYLMAYPTESSASFVGMERVTGSVGGRSGTFVLQHGGTFADGIAKDSYSVVPGSGTGDLSSLRGEGSNTTGHEEPHRYIFSYSFE